MNQEALTTFEIARHCQVTPRTIIQWINEGKLKAYRTPGNHSRVILKDFLDFLNKYNMPVPTQFIPEGQNDKKRILIVDDDRGMVDSIKRILIREKIYDIEFAYDGFEAGKKFSDFKPDLVILDIKMPGLNGYEVCSHIRSNPQNKDIKILFISAALEEGVKLIEELKADDYLAKPFSTESLRTKIQNLFGRNRRSGDMAKNVRSGNEA